MQDNDVGTALDARHETLVLLVLALVPVLMVLLLVPQTAVLHAVAGAAGLVAGLMLLLATLMSYLRWRTTPDPRQGWVVAAIVVVTCHVLVNNGVALAPAAEVHPRSAVPLTFAVVTSLIALALALGALRARSVAMPNPLFVGVAVGLAATAVRMLVLPVDVSIPSWLLAVLAACTLLIGVAIGAAVLANPTIPRWATWRLAATLILLAVGQAAAYGPVAGNAVDVVAAVASSLAGVLWTSATYVMLRDSLESQRRRAASLERSLFDVEASARGAREQLHEVRNTLAGLISAAHLLTDDSMADDVRESMQRSIRSELARLERLVSRQKADPALVSVDDTLETLAALHRARGLDVAWAPSGAHVVGRPDDLAEAVNILLDNAAAHGGATGSRVAVEPADDGEDAVTISVTDDGPGIPPDMRDKVFEWGVSRQGSPGEGIGLNLARRLVTEQGGSLTIAEPHGSGSSFVIRLPAPRLGEEAPA